MAELVGFGPSGSGVTPQGAPRDAGSLADNVSRTSSQPDLVSERIWWSEAMLSTIQNMLADQTRQLQASFVEESQKQQALAAQVQRLLAEHPQQLRGGAAEEAQENHDEAQLDEVAWGGRLAELLEREMEERRAGEACLLEKVQHHGDALARIEALIGPGASQDVDSVAESAAEEDCATRPPLEKSSTVGLSVRVSSALFEEDGSSTHSRCRMMAHQRRRFAVCTSCLIVANSIFLGLEANATITSSGLTTPDGIAWRLANAFFALAFLVELIVRWVSDGAAFFLLPRNPDCFWNWMDTLLILITVIEEILRYFTVDVITFGFLRLSRLLRVTRMMRAFKVVREFKELKIMVTGLLNCAKPLFWAGVLLACLTFMIGVLIAQLLTEYLRSVQDRDLDAEDAHAINYITRHFPNLWESMYSLFEALTGGRDWGEIARPFRHIHFVLTWCLVLYIVIGIFCILNLLTAVFLEAAHRVDNVQEHVYAKRDWVNGIRRFFLNALEGIPPSEQRLDSATTPRGTPVITEDVFVDILSSKSNVKFLEENGVDLFLIGASRLKELFSIMDKNGNGTLDVEEFVSCLYNLKGAATALELKLEHQKMSLMIRSLQEQLVRYNTTNSRASRRLTH